MRFYVMLFYFLLIIAMLRLPSDARILNCHFLYKHGTDRQVAVAEACHWFTGGNNFGIWQRSADKQNFIRKRQLRFWLKILTQVRGKIILLVRVIELF